MVEISKLHYITQDVPGVTHAQLAEKACQGGVEWVQLRVKKQPFETVKKEALETLKICRKHGARLIINDYPELAKEIGADGVHLGKTDMDPMEARTLLGKDFIIGGTANSQDDVERLIKSGAVDYIGLGPYRFTVTKEKLSPVLGAEGIRKIRASCNTLPIIAIGGIKAEDLDVILNTGVHGVAVSSAINLAKDPASSAKEFMEKLI